MSDESSDAGGHVRPADLDPRARQDDSSDEEFDRLAFAAYVLTQVRPRIEQVVVASGHHGVEVESGRYWGHGPGARWALMTVPARASSRAIVLAAAALAGTSASSWTLDALLAPTVAPARKMGGRVVPARAVPVRGGTARGRPER